MLARVARVLAEAEIGYRVTGGLAGNLHGSAWPLHDIDLDAPSGALEALAARFRAKPGTLPEDVLGPGRYRDEEFDIDLLELRLEGVDVDVAGTGDAAILTPQGARQSLRIDLARAELHRLGALRLPVAPLADLLDYKRVIGRTADLAELERLAGSARRSPAAPPSGAPR